MTAQLNQNSIHRLIELTNNDLNDLAKSITGLETCSINLIDAHYVWPISQNGIQMEVLPLQDSPCQFTLTKDDYFEVKHLANHDILKNKSYVKEAPFYKYYLGIPIKTKEGNRIGSISFFDTKVRELN